MKGLNIIRGMSKSGEWVRSWPKPKYGPVEVQRSELMNGIKMVAVQPSGAPLGACTIMYQAGSSHEDAGLNQLGVSHFLRAASCTSGCSYTGFAKLRIMQQFAASLSCTSDRQSIAYTLRCMPFDFCYLKSYLSDTAVRSTYNDWEIDDIRPMIFDDHNRITPEQRCLDLVQQACWRGPHSQSVYCNPDLMDQIDGDTLRQFTKRNFKTDHCTIASFGVPFDEVMKMAEKIDMSREKPAPREKEQSHPRGGFEYYDLGPGSDTWICAAVPSCGSGDPCLMHHAVIAASCNSDKIHFGSEPLDRNAKTPLSVFANDPFTNYRVFNISYQDSGIFGIITRTRSCSASASAHATVNFMKTLPEFVTPDLLQIGKNKLKLSIALHDAECTNVTESFASQLANNICLDTIADIAVVIDSTDSSEVMDAVNSLNKRCADHLAIAVVGDVGAVPHDGELRS